MSEHVPYEIEVRDPEGMHPDWSKHELRLTRGNQTQVIFLDDKDLIMLNRQLLHRIHNAVHVGE